MTINQAKKHPFWTLLTLNERKFLQHLALSKDWEKAVQEAYNANLRSVPALIGKLRRRFQVVFLADSICGTLWKPTHDELQQLVLWKLRQGQHSDKMFMKLVDAGLKLREPAVADPTPEISLDDFPDPAQ